MQLSVVSWVFFGLGTLMIIATIAIWTYAVIRTIRSNWHDEDDSFIVFFVGLFFLAVGGLLAGIISAGGMRAHDIQRDLTSQGYTVFDIETDSNTAIVLIDGYAREVQVINDGVSWKPYISCQILPNGEIVDQLMDCHVVNS